MSNDDVFFPNGFELHPIPEPVQDISPEWAEWMRRVEEWRRQPWRSVPGTTIRTYPNTNFPPADHGGMCACPQCSPIRWLAHNG